MQMKTKQFIDKISELGYVAVESHVGSSTIEIFKRNGVYREKLAEVDEKIKCSTDTRYTTFNELKAEDKDRLFKLLTEYANTDIEDRKDIIRYRVRVKMFEETRGYLNIATRDTKKRKKGELYFGGCTTGSNFSKNCFTSKELSGLPDAIKVLVKDTALAVVEPVVVN